MSLAAVNITWVYVAPFTLTQLITIIITGNKIWNWIRVIIDNFEERGVKRVLRVILIVLGLLDIFSYRGVTPKRTGRRPPPYPHQEVNYCSFLNISDCIKLDIFHKISKQTLRINRTLCLIIIHLSFGFCSFDYCCFAIYIKVTIYFSICCSCILGLVPTYKFFNS